MRIFEDQMLLINIWLIKYLQLLGAVVKVLDHTDIYKNKI